MFIAFANLHMIATLEERLLMDGQSNIKHLSSVPKPADVFVLRQDLHKNGNLMLIQKIVTTPFEVFEFKYN